MTYFSPKKLSYQHIKIGNNNRINISKVNENESILPKKQEFVVSVDQLQWELLKSQQELLKSEPNDGWKPFT